MRVDKELYGDVFRRSPKLTPLEARAISLAIDYVGPTIAAEAGTPLDRVRRKLQETFGQFDARPAPGGSAGDARGAARPHALGRRREAPDGRDRVPQGGRREPDDALRRAVHVRARASGLARAHLGPDGGRTADLPARPHALGTSHRGEFEPRAGFDPNYLREPRTAKLWHSPVVARWKLERGARLLTDKAAISDLPYKTDEWLLSEVLGDGGETVVLEPAEARAMVATRAKALQQELGVSARRKRPAARA